MALFPGTFVYTRPSGKVLSVGNGQTFSSTFTPSDTIDYNVVTASVQINVLAPAQIVVTPTLSRNGSGQMVATLKISNTGGVAAQSTQLTVGKLNTASGTPLPQALGTWLRARR